MIGHEAGARSTDPGRASQFINAMGDEAISTLRATNLPPEARDSKFRALLVRDFGLQFIGRFVLGQHWRCAALEQQQAYQQAFNEYVLQAYANWLNGYAGETLTVTSERSAGAKDILVDMRIDRPSGPPVAVQWRVRAIGSDSCVVDVVVESMSLVVTQRAETWKQR